MILAWECGRAGPGVEDRRMRSHDSQPAIGSGMIGTGILHRDQPAPLRLTDAGRPLSDCATWASIIMCASIPAICWPSSG